MEDSWLYQTTMQYRDYASLLIIAATWIDVFFLTGLVFNGFAMLTIALTLITTGVVEPIPMVIAAIVGTISGNVMNYWVGRWFGATPYIKKTLDRPTVAKARAFLNSHALFISIVLCRFTTFTRPLYALVLGSMNIKFQRFLFWEIPVAIFWVVFWMWVIIQGEALVMGWLG